MRTPLTRVVRWMDRVWRVAFVATRRGLRAFGRAPRTDEGAVAELERACGAMHAASMSAIARQVRTLQAGSVSGGCSRVTARLDGRPQATLAMLETLHPALAGLTDSDGDDGEGILARCSADER